MSNETKQHLIKEIKNIPLNKKEKRTYKAKSGFKSQQLQNRKKSK